MRIRNKVAMLAGASLASATWASGAGAATVVTVPITNDTFIDSSAAGDVVNGVDQQSYGADGSVKVVVSDTPDTFSAGDVASYTHVLFQVPAVVLADYAAGLVSDVTVSYYPKNDSLAGAGANNNADGDNVIQLHPLTQSFTVGNGTQTPATPSTTGGATWATYNGTNPWATAGGDFDATNYVIDDNATLPPSKGTVPFTWDVTPLLANSVTASELAANGAILVLPDPIAQVPYGTQDFTSLYSANNTSSTPFISVTLVPEPATASWILLGGVACIARRRPGHAQMIGKR